MIILIFCPAFAGQPLLSQNPRLKSLIANTCKAILMSNFTRSNRIEPMEVFKDEEGLDLPPGERIGLMWNR